MLSMWLLISATSNEGGELQGEEHHTYENNEMEE